MPLVRIDLRKGKPETYRAAVSRIVHEALVSVGVPKDDRFQVIRRARFGDSFVFDLSYLDIRRTEDLVIIQITWNEGRTVDQKKALYKAIADNLASGLSLRREDVFISLIEVKQRKLVVRRRNCAIRMNLLANAVAAARAMRSRCRGACWWRGTNSKPGPSTVVNQPQAAVRIAAEISGFVRVRLPHGQTPAACPRA